MRRSQPPSNPEAGKIGDNWAHKFAQSERFSRFSKSFWRIEARSAAVEGAFSKTCEERRCQSARGSQATDNETTKVRTRDLGQLLSILAGALLLRLMYFTGIGGYDDIDYFRYALDVLNGNFSTHVVGDGSFPFRFRVGLIYPTAAMFRIFGVSEYSAAVLPLLNSLGLVALSWWGGRRISRHTGALAAALMATFPMAICQATTLMPDSFAAFFSGLSVLTWLTTEDHEQGGALTDRAAGIRYFVAGLFLGLGYFFRIEVGLFVMFFVGFAVLHRRAFKGCVLALIGAATPVALENFVYLGLHGEFLYRLKAVSGGFDFISGSLHDFVATQKSPLHYLKVIFLKPTELGLHWAAILPVALLCLGIRRPERRAYLIWFWPVMLYLLFGSWSLSSYVPTTKEPRYLFGISIPGIILVAALAEQIIARLPRWKIAVNFGLISLLLGSLTLLNVGHIYSTENAAAARIAANYLRQNVDADDPIWCEHYSLSMLQSFCPGCDYRLLHRHDISFNANETLIDTDEMKSGYMVVDEFVINKYRRDAGLQPPDYLLNPPSDWQLVFEAPHPTTGFRYTVLRAIASLIGRNDSGPALSLRTDPIRIYAVAPHSSVAAN